jgi:hypothetical protein
MDLDAEFQVQWYKKIKNKNLYNNKNAPVKSI